MSVSTAALFPSLAIVITTTLYRLASQGCRCRHQCKRCDSGPQSKKAQIADSMKKVQKLECGNIHSIRIVTDLVIQTTNQKFDLQLKEK